MPFDDHFDLISLDDLVLPTETCNPKSMPAQSFQYVDISSVCNKDFQITNPKTVPGADAPSRARKTIRAFDVIFATTRPYLKSIARVPARLNNQVCSTGFCVLRAGERILPEWLFYCVTSDQFMEQITPIMRGANYPAVTDRDIRSARIPVPSREKQRSLVKTIDECFQAVDEIKNLRSAAFLEARYVASSLFSAIAESNDVPSKKLGEVIVSSGNGRSIPQDNENATGFVLSLSAVHDVSLDCESPKPIVLPENIATRYRIEEGDVFVSRSNTRELVGLSSVATQTPTERLIYPDLLIKLVADQTIILPRYLAYALRTSNSRRQIRDLAVGTSQSMVKISGAKLKDVAIPVPSIATQESLIDRFDALHSLTSQLTSEMQSPELGHLRDAILRKAFAGEM